MPHLLALTTARQQRKYALDDHSPIPLATLTDFDILGIAAFRVKARISTNHHFFFKLSQKRVKLNVRNICRRGLKTANKPEFIQHHAQFPANYPARI